MAITTIPLSKRKPAAILAGCVVMMGLGVWMVVQYHSLGAVMGVMNIVCFGGMGFYAFQVLRQDRPGLVIDDEGFTDDSTGTSVGRVYWSDVKGLHEWNMPGQKCLCVEVKNPQQYLARAKPLARKLMAANIPMTGTPVALSAFSLAVGYDEMAAKIRQAWAHYQRVTYLHEDPGPADATQAAARGGAGDSVTGGTANGGANGEAHGGTGDSAEGAAEAKRAQARGEAEDGSEGDTKSSAAKAAGRPGAESRNGIGKSADLTSPQQAAPSAATAAPAAAADAPIAQPAVGGAPGQTPSSTSDSATGFSASQPATTSSGAPDSLPPGICDSLPLSSLPGFADADNQSPNSKGAESFLVSDEPEALETSTESDTPVVSTEPTESEVSGRRESSEASQEHQTPEAVRETMESTPAEPVALQSQDPGAQESHGIAAQNRDSQSHGQQSRDQQNSDAENQDSHALETQDQESQGWDSHNPKIHHLGTENPQPQFGYHESSEPTELGWPSETVTQPGETTTDELSALPLAVIGEAAPTGWAFVPQQRNKATADRHDREASATNENPASAANQPEPVFAMSAPRSENSSASPRSPHSEEPFAGTDKSHWWLEN